MAFLFSTRLKEKRFFFPLNKCCFLLQFVHDISCSKNFGSFTTTYQMKIFRTNLSMEIKYPTIAFYQFYTLQVKDLSYCN